MKKISNYVEIIKYKKQIALWNKLNGLLILLENEHIVSENGIFYLSTKDNEILKYFEDNLFLVKDEYVQNKIREGSFNKNEIKITLSPTERCNCQCKYCYQCDWNYEDALDDDEYLKVAKKVLIKIVDSLPDDSEIILRYIGGEPLLKSTLLVKIKEELKTIIRNSNKKIKVVYELDSNCTLLTREFILCFENLDISTTLTLAKDHNKLRDNSFDRTVNNLLDIKDLFKLPQYKLNIGYNVHQDNIKDFEKFLILISNIGIECSVYVCNIVNYPNTSFQNKLSNEIFEDIYLEKIIPLMHKYGYEDKSLLPAFGMERQCDALNPLSGKVYSNGKIVPCSFFDNRGKSILLNTNNYHMNFTNLPEMCVKCYDFPSCGGYRPCIECSGEYSKKENVRKRIITYLNLVGGK